MSALLPEKFFIHDAWTVAAWPHEISHERPLAYPVG